MNKLIQEAKDEIKMFDRPSARTSSKLVDSLEEITHTLAKVLDATRAISRDEDCDWHHEDLEKAAKLLNRGGKVEK